jgi:succinyl-CoA synthetase beta subunit
MKIHEYQAKGLLDHYGVPVQKGSIARSPSEARLIAEQFGGDVVVKAQVHSGGRGRAGGIKVAKTPDEVEKVAERLLGTRLVTSQTGPEGLPVNAVLVAEAVDIKRELYLSILTDTQKRIPVMIGAAVGGMDIEELALKSPEKLCRVHIDPVSGLMPYQCRRLAYSMELTGDQFKAALPLFAGVYRLFQQMDCSLLEINPLAVTADGRLVAIDAKVNLDDSAVSRHPDIIQMRDVSQENPLDIEAENLGVNYVKLDGSIGCMVNGAGLAMATMDLIKWAGGEPANFLDVGGGASEDQVVGALKLLMSDPKVKVAWVNIFGGILRCDLVARAVVRALNEKELSIPFVVRMNGTNVEEGIRLLKESDLNIIFESDLTEAAKRAVAASR